MTASFSDIDWVVPADTTKVLTIKLDIRDAGLLSTTFVVSTDANDITAENSSGTTVTATGSADGKTLTIRKVGPEIKLLSKSITTDGVPQGSPAVGVTSTSTMTATFKVNIKAVGGDLTIGSAASTSHPLFASTTASFDVYRNGATSGANSAATSTSYTIPSTCTSVGTNSCTLAEGADVDVEVAYQIQGRATTGAVLTSGLYAVGIEGIQWFNSTTGSVQTTTFMAGLTDWRTSDVSFP